MKKVKLPKQFKTKWIKALRSGKFIQGNGKLKQKYSEGEIKHCCLGVAGEICGVKSLLNKDMLVPKEGLRGITKVPIELRDNMKLQYKLAAMNDEKSYNFNKIANWIEKYL